MATLSGRPGRAGRPSSSLLMDGISGMVVIVSSSFAMYNVDAVLSVMVKGLEEELKDRLTGRMNFVSKNMSPSPQYEIQAILPQELPMVRQGASVRDVFDSGKKLLGWYVERKVIEIE